MEGMTIEAYMSRERGDPRPLAQGIMEQVIAWFEDPDHEAEYQEWKKAREARKGA